LSGLHKLINLNADKKLEAPVLLTVSKRRVVFTWVSLKVLKTLVVGIAVMGRSFQECFCDCPFARALARLNSCQYCGFEKRCEPAWLALRSRWCRKDGAAIN
jgi:hypothetical protein